MSLIKTEKLKITSENLAAFVVDRPSFGVIPLAVAHLGRMICGEAEEAPTVLPDLSRLVECKPVDDQGRYRIVVVYNDPFVPKQKAYSLDLDFSAETDRSPERIRELIREALFAQSQFHTPEIGD